MTAGRFVGARIARREDPRLLTGAGRFVGDVRVPGMLHVAFVRSPHPHARVLRIDPAPALAAPGVVAVLTGADLNPMVHVMRSAYAAHDDPDIRPLARDRVRFAGDPVALVVATDRYLAEDAAELVEIDYAPSPPLVDFEVAPSSATLVWDHRPGNVAFEFASLVPARLDQAIADAHHVVDETFRQHRQALTPMEPHGLIVTWGPRSGRMEIRISHQLPHQVRAFAARLTGLPTNRVRVVQEDVGGGFGQKAAVSREEAAVILAGYRLGRPLRWLADRWENLVAGGHAREELIHVRMGFTADGLITGAQVEHLECVGAYGLGGYNGKWVGMMFPGPYRVPLYAYTARSVFTHTAPRVPYRAPWMIESVGRERAMDLAARALGLDPLEIRRRNALSLADQPYRTASGMEYEAVTPAETLAAVVQHAGYAELRVEQAAARAQGRHLGIGLSVTVEPTAKAGPLGVEVATIRIEPDGAVHLLMGTGSHGQSLETTMPQIVADELGVDPADVVLLQGDTDAAPNGGGTGGSRSAVIGGAAARLGSQRLAGKVRELAAHLLEAAPDDVELTDGRAQVRGAPGTAVPIAELARISYEAPDRMPEGMEPGLEATSRFAAPPATYSNAAHLCLCELDPETGQLTVLRHVVACDCGVMINPAVVEGQIAGGVVQGLGGAVYEEFRYDADGNPQSSTFLDYTIPTTAEVPRIEYTHLETPSPTPGGHKGVGEGGVLGAVPAVLAAAEDAAAPWGITVTRQPIGPAQLLALLDAARPDPA